MASFVHLEYSHQHGGVERIESALASARQMGRDFSTPRSLAMLLLSAIAAAVVVVAHQVMDSMADGHLLVLWVAMWAAAFAALAAFAGSARLAIGSVKCKLDAWSRRVAIKRADERLWAMARTDARLMADLQAVISRNSSHDEGLQFVAPTKAAPKLATEKPAVIRAVPPEAAPAPYQRLYI